jgi:hypothetical protein
VNQDGERVHGFDVNTLTVIATESYEEFAENLQKEIEEDTGIRFGLVEPHQFARSSSTPGMMNLSRWVSNSRRCSGRHCTVPATSTGGDTSSTR